MEFLYPDVALYLEVYTIQSCMKYCCHVWGSALICYLGMLERLVVCPSVADSIEPLAHRNVAR